MALTSGGLKFGVFVPPQNRVGVNPNLAIRRSVELIEHLDRFGYDEAWVGEHHSGGAELIASPELVLACAAERTRSIRLGTGVVSLPYHHPFQVAERFVLLDHLTRGRVMFGMGPGQLPTDAWMHGLEATQLRPRMEQSLAVILRLQRGETVTESAEWYTLRDAVLQLAPFSDLSLSVVGTVSPAGPKLAGRHGLGLLSLAATDPAGNDMLPRHWDIMNEEADRHGHHIDRREWRLMGPMHIAESEREARDNCRYGLRWQYEYLRHITPSAIDVPNDSDDLADLLNRTGRGVIGTPEMAVAQIRRLIERTGGFGTFLLQGIDFADWEATLRSYRLIAEEVIPHFDGQLQPVETSYRLILDRAEQNRSATAAAREAAAQSWEAERKRPKDLG
ncbi:MAG: LLM class flavin-dependent oxidoreductase [Novosphingobium sp.]|nr:LLM class flavin-dependent oxidoreductase [Novosphingobium sp.]MCP5388315.1 LLM class flavin-dependent oxidoreductase [Novosphingobium sp.]